MRRVKAVKGPRRPEAHEPGKEPKEQNSSFPLGGTHSTNQPAKARMVSTDSNGNAAHQIARHVTAWPARFLKSDPRSLDWQAIARPLGSHWVAIG
jgi:hypothetical protein